MAEVSSRRNGSQAAGTNEIKYTIDQCLARRVAETPKAKALCFKRDGEWRNWTWAEYGERINRFAKSLMALGIEAGDKVALIGSNTPEWYCTDMAVMTLGAVTVPVYATSSGEQIQYILNHSEAKMYVAESVEYVERIADRLDRIPTLTQMVMLFGEKPPEPDILHSLDEFENAGKTVSDEALQKQRSKIDPDFPATLLYTSGTTGPPKAVILTHMNSCASGENVWLAIGNRSGGEQESFCTYLPLSHVAERCVNLFTSLFDGHSIHFMRGYQTFAEDLKEIRPTIWMGVPRVWEKLYEGVMEYRTGLPVKQKKIVDWALKTGSDHNWLVYEKKPIPLGLKLKYRLARKMVINKLLAALGLERVGMTVTGGAPTSKAILDFYVSIGLWLMDVYGQTEGHGTTSIARPNAIRFGSAGLPFPKTKVRIAEDGEILVQGDHVSPGYYKDPELTAETFKDGWLHSGDLGYIDDDGFLWVTGRKKDIIITSGGKNITPSKIESALMGHPLIEHAVVVGDGRKYLTALLTVSFEDGARRMADEGKQIASPNELSRESSILDEVRRHVEQVNSSLSRVEQVKKYKILPGAFSIESGELTHVLKVKRKVVEEKFIREVNKMYE